MVEPNNTDQSYVDLPIILPSILFAFLSLSAFAAAIVLGLMYEDFTLLVYFIRLNFV